MPVDRNDSSWYKGYRNWEGNEGIGDEDPEAQAAAHAAALAQLDNPEAYNNRFQKWECNDPSATVDPPHIVMMTGLILITLGGLIGFGLLIDVAPATAIKTWLMWSGGVGVVLGIMLGVLSVVMYERRDPPAPPSAP